LSVAAHRWLPAAPIMCGLLPLLKLSAWAQALGNLPQYRRQISLILHSIVAAYLIICRSKLLNAMKGLNVDIEGTTSTPEKALMKSLKEFIATLQACESIIDLLRKVMYQLAETDIETCC